MDRVLYKSNHIHQAYRHGPHQTLRPRRIPSQFAQVFDQQEKYHRELLSQQCCHAHDILVHTKQDSELWEAEYSVAGSKDGRMVLFTFGCALLGSDLQEKWSTPPMLMITPWSYNGENIKNLPKRFDIVRDQPSVDEF
jgi:hypothetical protein